LPLYIASALRVVGQHMNERITFRASIPPIQSAIKLGSDGARIQLDVPEMDLDQILELVRSMKNKALLVQVSVYGEDGREDI